MGNILKITTQTNLVCIFGHPVGHSLSPLMHNAAFQDLELDFAYMAFDVHPNNLEAAFNGVRALNIKGVNVTLPYKQEALNHMDEIDPMTKVIGALNTVKNENGKLIGRNTDALGVKKALKDANFELKNKKVVILGSGGAARAITYSIIKDIDELTLINRTLKNARRLSEELQKYMNKPIKILDFKSDSIESVVRSAEIIINTTPIGMHPYVKNSPIPKEYLHEDLSVFDVIYNPLKTKFVKDADEQGCRTLGGLEMLLNQGALAFEWWTSKKPNLEIMKSKVIEFLEGKS